MISRTRVIPAVAVSLVAFLVFPAAAYAQYVGGTGAEAGPSNAGAVSAAGGSASGSAGGGGSLPVTGAQVGWMVALAVVLLCVGAALVWYNRRRAGTS